MNIFVEEIYTFEKETATIGIRHPTSFAFETGAIEEQPETLRQVHVARGLSPMDFGFFVDILSEGGVDRESFLMTSYMRNGRGIVMPRDDILNLPEHYLTSELARKISLCEPDEIRQFGLGSLIKVVKRRYPGIK